MIKTTAMILEELTEYESPEDKLSRLVKSGEYIRIARGLYETEKSTPGYLLAESIYGPSYLSFEFALSYYGLIPEMVRTFTSATFKKKKKKTYINAFGRFTYRDIPAKVFSFGVDFLREGAYCYKMATPEKAVCDQLYQLQPIANYRELETLLFENMRIDQQSFYRLNGDDILFLAERYGSRNVKRLAGYVRRKFK